MKVVKGQSGNPCRRGGYDCGGGGYDCGGGGRRITDSRAANRQFRSDAKRGPKRLTLLTPVAKAALNRPN